MAPASPAGAGPGQHPGRACPVHPPQTPLPSHGYGSPIPDRFGLNNPRSGTEEAS